MSKAAGAPASLVLEVVCEDAGGAEWALAEAMEAGALGAVEREERAGAGFDLYVAPSCEAAVRVALARVPGAAVNAAAPVEDTDWSEAWKEGLSVLEISPRLRIRPSVVAASPPQAGQAELVIDPAQAFGTGAHESTRLALECLDALAPLAPEAAVLDVGAGTGVLALAALRLGARRAVALDLDPLAGEATRDNARVNRLEGRVLAYTGPVTALRTEAFDLVVSNMLKRELLPVLSDLVCNTSGSGTLVLSGLLGTDRDEMSRALADHGLHVELTRERRDESGVGWLGLVARRR